MNLTTESKQPEWSAALANPYKPDPVILQDGVIRGGQKIPRNALCPCGSGRKWKRCHGE